MSATATLAERLGGQPLTPDDPDVLPGTADTAAPDGPDGQLSAGLPVGRRRLRAGLSMRNYGFFIDLARYNLPARTRPEHSRSLPTRFTTVR